jgi:hypothetical protein
LWAENRGREREAETKEAKNGDVDNLELTGEVGLPSLLPLRVTMKRVRD